jgi:DNA-binding FadR family transcriptional regulator
VVKWRGQGPDYVLQMQQLLEVRLGIEQAAARLAAERISADDAQEILDMANLMKSCLQSGERRRFFDADVAFHRLLLEGTNNAVMAQLADTIGATLHVRGGDPRPGMHDISMEAVEHHISLAEAIVAGDSKRAQEQALLLVEGTLHEFENIPSQRQTAPGASPASPSLT